MRARCSQRCIAKCHKMPDLFWTVYSWVFCNRIFCNWVRSEYAAHKMRQVIQTIQYNPKHTFLHWLNVTCMWICYSHENRNLNIWFSRARSLFRFTFLMCYFQQHMWQYNCTHFCDLFLSFQRKWYDNGQNFIFSIDILVAALN